MRSHHPALNVATLIALAASLFTGCKSIGPATVARDRYDYSSSIAESWKRQTLLNIVKMRYVDPPIFVDVDQIVAGYSLETGVSVGGQISAPRDDSLSLGASGKFTDRPTITYTPLTGNQFVKALMTPLSPESVFFTIQSGWPADIVLLASAASINGLKNQETTIHGAKPPDAGFLRVLELLRSLQRSGTVSFRVEQDTKKQAFHILTLRSQEVTEATLAATRELRQLLKLDPDATEFRLVFGGLPSSDKELAVITRSILHIMNNMAAQVDAPAEDVASGRASPGSDPKDESVRQYALVRIHSSKRRPADAAVAVLYRNHWFWIDDRDLQSKRAFAYMQILFTLADMGEKESLPLITIPAH